MHDLGCLTYLGASVIKIVLLMLPLAFPCTMQDISSRPCTLVSFSFRRMGLDRKRCSSLFLLIGPKLAS